MYSCLEKSSSFESDVFSINNWIIFGIASLDHSPIELGFTGTSLEKISLVLVELTVLLIISDTKSLRLLLFGRKTIPVAYCPSFGKSTPILFNSSL